VPDSLLVRAIDLLPEDEPSVPAPSQDASNKIPPV